eukprot:1008834_1
MAFAPGSRFRTLSANRPASTSALTNCLTSTSLHVPAVSCLVEETQSLVSVATQTFGPDGTILQTTFSTFPDLSGPKADDLPLHTTAHSVASLHVVLAPAGNPTKRRPASVRILSSVGAAHTSALPEKCTATMIPTITKTPTPALKIVCFVSHQFGSNGGAMLLPYSVQRR